MPTVTYDTFFPEVMPFVYGCADMAAERAIMNAVIDFCIRSDWWVLELDPIMAAVGVGDYELDELPDQTEIVRIVDAWYGDRQLTQLSLDELRKKFGLSWRDTPAGFPSFVTQIMPGVLTVVPALQAGTPIENITGFVSLRPTRDSTSCDDSIYNRWAEVIGHGALARLYATVGQPFSNPPAAQAFETKFSAGVANARRERLKGLGRGGDRVQMPRFV